MKKIYLLLTALPFFLLLTGCMAQGEDSCNLSYIYLICASLSLLLLISYITLIKNKSFWFILLYSSVFVVNSGYTLLAFSTTVDAALWANRISYLGSVALPMAMLFIILKVSKLKYPKALPFILFGLAFIMFCIAGSPGVLDIYYKSVTLSENNGATVLIKEYGPLHSMNTFYLLGYMLAMINISLLTVSKKGQFTAAQSIILTIAVFSNVCVWLLEQAVELNFEFLSVSYIISEVFLLFVFYMVDENRLAAMLPVERAPAVVNIEDKTPTKSTDTKKESPTISFNESLLKGVEQLTPTEALIFRSYLEGMSTKETREKLNITVNTLKFHNRNIYSKLGVSTRKELLSRAFSDESENGQGSDQKQ